MNDIFNKNISLFQKRFPEIAEAISGMSGEPEIKTIESKTGLPVPAVQGRNRAVYIHSRFDPAKEAQRFVDEISVQDRDLFIIFGFGYAYHIDELLLRIPTESSLLIIEKNIEMIAGAASTRDLSSILGDNRVAILVDPEHDQIADALSGRSSARVSFITHRGSHQIYPDYYSKTLDTAKSSVSTKEVNIATLAKFEDLWASNIIRNTLNFILNPGINIFFDKFKGLPGILCAAGPSLHESLPLLKEVQNRAVIAAVDTAYGILLKNGITPHFCISADPQIVNARYFEGCPETGTILAADPTTHPSVFRMFKGRKSVSGIVFDAMKWIESFSEEKGETAHGGSVSTNAYDFLKKIGTSPVIMVGQDLAFTGGYAHCPGSYLDSQIHLKSDRFKTPENFNRFQLTALPEIKVKGIKSPTVHTNRKMTIFLSWFERRRDDSLINATPDGAIIPGVKHTPVENIKFEETGMDIFSLIDSIYSSGTLVSKQHDIYGLYEKSIEIYNALESVIPHISRAFSLSEELIRLTEKQSSYGKKIGKILDSLDEIDRIIQSKKSIKEIISFTSQKAIHTITEGYEINLDEKNMSAPRKTALKSKFLYEGLLKGTRFNKRLFRKLSLILSESLNEKS